MKEMTTCIGVDGAKAAWLGVWRHKEGLAHGVYETPAALMLAHRRAKVVAVDIPIGLTEELRRDADVEARRFVGGYRASSVFSAPVRCVLDAPTQREASRLHRLKDGRGFGVQGFAILPKIRRWDQFLQLDKRSRNRVYEVHPEVSFAALRGGKGLEFNKKTREGFDARLRLLATVFDIEALNGLLGSVDRKLAARDDVLDALVALWSAERILSGDAVALPDPIPYDAMGLPMAIRY